jgi:hypothetical protein
MVAPWLAVSIVLVGSYLFVAVIDHWAGDRTFLGLSKDIVLKVVGSLLASAVFYLVLNLLLALKQAPLTVEHSYFERIHGSFGIIEVYDQRGGTSALAQYCELLGDAKMRIWAMGITNRRFLQTNFDILVRALLSSPSMDIRLIFADPTLNVSWDQAEENGVRKSPVAGINLQMHLEGQAPEHTDWRRHLDQYLERLETELPASEKVGTIRILTFRSICFSTCFVIDDDVFFFPMLARVDSAQDPTIHVGANSVLGRCIIDHMNRVCGSVGYSQCIYENKETKSRSIRTAAVAR